MKKHRRLLIGLLSAMLLLAALLLAAALFFTSDWFLQSVALPYVGRKLELELTADRVSYSWRKNQLTVVQLRGGSENDPCFLMGGVCFQPDFKEILRGRLGCSTFHFHRPQLALYHQPNGDWTLYPSGRHIYFENVPEIRLKNLSWDQGRFLVVSGRPGAGNLVEFSGFHGGSASFANTDPFRLELKGFLKFGSQPAEMLRSGDCEIIMTLQLDEEFSLRHLAVESRIREMYGNFRDESFTHLGLKGSFMLDFPRTGGTLVKHCRVESRDRGKIRSLIDLSGELFDSSDGFRCQVREGRMMPEMTSLLGELLLDFDPGTCTVDFKGSAGWRKEHFLVLRGGLSVDRRGDCVWHGRRLKARSHRLQLAADLELDWQKRYAAIRSGMLTLNEAENPVLLARLSQPVTCALDAADGERSCASFDYQIRALDLASIATFLPPDQPLLPAGRCSGSGQLTVGNRVNGLQLGGEWNFSELRWQTSAGVLPADRLLLRFQTGLNRQGSFSLPRFAASLGAGKETLAELSYQEREGVIPGELFFQARMDSRALPRLAPEKSRLRSVLEFFDRTDAAVRLTGRRQGSILSVISGKVALKGAEPDHLSLDVDPFQLELFAMDPQNDVVFRSTGAVSSERIRRFISTSRIYPEGGVLRWQTRGCITRNWRNVRCRGWAELQNTRLHLWHVVLPESTAEPRFDLSFQDLNELKIDQLELRLKDRHGRVMLNFQGTPSQWHLAPESFSGGGTLTDLNADILNAAFPGTFAAANVTGKVRGVLQNGVFDGALALQLIGGRTLRTQTELDGELAFEVRQQEGELLIRPFRFSLSDQHHLPWLVLEGSFQRGKENFLLKLDAPELDAGQLLAILPARSEAAIAKTAAPDGGKPSAPPPSLPPVRCGEIRLNCAHLVVAPDIQGSLSGHIQMRPAAIPQSEFVLRLNGAEGVLNLAAENVPEGIRIRQKFSLKSPLEIAPFSRLVTGRSDTLSRGKITAIESDFTVVDNGSWDGSLRTFSGNLMTQLQELRIQPGLEHAPGIKVLFYPVDIFSHVAAALPETFGEWRRKMVESARFSDYMTAVSFRQGQIRLTAAGDRITLKECDFSGEEQLVRHLTMEGEFGLHDDSLLALNARVSGAAGQLTIPITGTLNAPKVDFSSIATASAGDFFRKVKSLNLVGVVSAAPGQQDAILVLDHLPAAGFWKATGRFFRNCFGGTDTRQGIL